MEHMAVDTILMLYVLGMEADTPAPQARNALAALTDLVGFHMPAIWLLRSLISFLLFKYSNLASSICH